MTAFKWEKTALSIVWTIPFNYLTSEQNLVNMLLGTLRLSNLPGEHGFIT